MNNKFFKAYLAQFSFFIACVFYAFSINLCHKTYLLEVQEIWGFTYYGLSNSSYYLILFFVLITSFNISLRLNCPSRFIIFLLYIVVYLPTLVLTLALKRDSLEIYGEGIICLTFGIIFISLVTKLNSNNFKNVNFLVPTKKSEYFFLVLWLFCFTILLYLFKDKIKFVGLDDIYAQRAAGRSRNIFEAYMQTYFPNVICTALMTYGLMLKKRVYIILAFAGYFLVFGITAQRSIFLMPLVLFGLFNYLKNATYNKYTLTLVVLLIAFIFIIVSFLPNGNLRSFIGFYFVTRIFGFPGIMIALYYDTFSQLGYTHWSNIKGFSSVTDVPAIFKFNSDWPNLGYIVSIYKYGLNANFNANLFAYDGMAAANGLGILVVCVILTFYLLVFDKVTRNIDPQFKVMISFPIGLALTNGSLATILLSFGGLFWIAFFLIVNKRKINLPTVV